MPAAPAALQPPHRMRRPVHRGKRRRGAASGCRGVAAAGGGGPGGAGRGAARRAARPAAGAGAAAAAARRGPGAPSGVDRGGGAAGRGQRPRSQRRPPGPAQAAPAHGAQLAQGGLPLAAGGHQFSISVCVCACPGGGSLVCVHLCTGHAVAPVLCCIIANKPVPLRCLLGCGMHRSGVCASNQQGEVEMRSDLERALVGISADCRTANTLATATTATTAAATAAADDSCERGSGAPAPAPAPPCLPPRPVTATQLVHVTVRSTSSSPTAHTTAVSSPTAQGGICCGGDVDSFTDWRHKFHATVRAFDERHSGKQRG